jgi:hypothetical protein
MELGVLGLPGGNVAEEEAPDPEPEAAPEPGVMTDEPVLPVVGVELKLDGRRGARGGRGRCRGGGGGTAPQARLLLLWLLPRPLPRPFA